MVMAIPGLCKPGYNSQYLADDPTPITKFHRSSLEDSPKTPK